MDHEVLREVWEGKIPVEFVLAEELSLLETPKPFYALVPRLSYFPLLLDKVAKYFLSLVSAEEVEELWLEYEGEALRWDLPIGVLFDSLKRDEGLPWRIGLRLKAFPADKVLRLGPGERKEALEALFIQSLKEADHLKHRGAVVSAMSKREHKQLWTSLLGDRYDQFWAVNGRLMEGGGEAWGGLPLRVHLEDGAVAQRLWTATKADGERRLLSDLAEELGLTGRRWLCHGVALPLDTPLLWLARNLAYPDNFAHLVPLPP